MLRPALRSVGQNTRHESSCEENHALNDMHAAAEDRIESQDTKKCMRKNAATIVLDSKHSILFFI